MAYSHDRIVDTDNTMSRDSDWFRINQSKSGTPVSQSRARDRELLTYPNAPLRTVHAPDPLMDEARAAMAALLLRKPLALDYLTPMAPMEPATRLAMHGGTAKGERSLAPKRRDKPMAFHCQPTCVPPREDRAAPAPAFRPTSFHAVADQRIARGKAEAAALEAAREASRRR